MSYAHVKNGAVVRFLAELPFSFAGIARFRSLTAEQQAAAGIVPVVDVTGPVDPLTSALVDAAPTITVYADRVEQLRPVRALTEEEAAQALADLRAAALAEIDASAESARLRYITGGAGQAATYLIKERQAEAFRDAGYAGDAPGMVQAEMDATGLSAQAACDSILAQRDAWVGKAEQIEEARRVGKVGVDAAADGAAVITARDEAVAALDAL